MTLTLIKRYYSKRWGQKQCSNCQKAITKAPYYTDKKAKKGGFYCLSCGENFLKNTLYCPNCQKEIRRAVRLLGVLNEGKSIWCMRCDFEIWWNKIERISSRPSEFTERRKQNMYDIFMEELKTRLK